MIFVTVGTHEQQFNRLVKKVDELKRDGLIREDVLIQTGYSTFEPRYCRWSQWFPYAEMVKHVEKAHIIITHGGPSSFIMPLQVGKTPIVVPRQAKFDEHVNNHQVYFCNAVADRYGSILVIEDIEKLGDSIIGYEQFVKSMPGKQDSNNARFNAELEKIVEEMM
ncbi:MAG: glycosyltransferase [Lachnospiraceae bacterium]|nr:glycosyltransferase [Lachnospiraceae bacterium]